MSGCSSTLWFLTCGFCPGSGSSAGSLASSEQLPDSDSELDDGADRRSHSRRLVKQESQVSMDEEDSQSCRDSLDLSSQSAPPTEPDPELEAEQDPEEQVHPEGAEPPALPDSAPPEEEEAEEQELSASLAELNMNQSNNNYPCSPMVNVSGLQLARLCGKKLPLTRNRDSEPEFV